MRRRGFAESPVAVAVAVAVAVLSCSRREVPVPPPRTPAALAQQSKLFDRRVEQVTDGVYVAVGYALANVEMVAVDGGKVIIDATESVAAAREIRAEFDRLVPGPVRALIYTHSHPDHILGASVFHDGNAPIWAHARAREEMAGQFAALGTTLRRRGAHQYGENLPPGLVPNNGIGPFLRVDDGPVPPLLFPTDTFTGVARFAVGGVDFEFHEAPGETTDQILVWLPGRKALFPGDDVYQAFPNLYSTRGVPPRPVKGWIASLDAMRGLSPDFLIPSHTGPVVGKEKIAEILTAYRDGIAFVHDSVIRMANAGRSVDDMARAIVLPPHLRDHPYLRELYGEVGWSVRGIYDGYLGWFDGNPTRLRPLHPADHSARLVPLLGGREKVLAEAARALDRGDAQWSAELADHLLALREDDADAKTAKARALRALGERAANPNERAYLLTSALELEGKWSPPGRPRITAGTLTDLPIEVLMDALPARLRPEKTADVVTTIGFDFTDTGKRFAFHVRRGVGEIAARTADSPDLALASTEADFKALIAGDLSPAVAIATGRVRVAGGLARLVAFRSYLLEP
jgi:alkyl sulfatase BDS1-like metallo-beta-lactamase superfamily hydrolase